jgi:ribose 5-phosphate isomerase A
MPSTDADLMKQRAARAALSEVREGTIVGVGTGSTVNHFIDALAAHVRVKAAVSSSEASTQRLRGAGIDVIDLNEAGEIGVYVDGADEATPARHLIKGGGGALTRENKLVERLGRFPLPIEVIPMARRYVADQLSRLGRPVWREGFVTDNGNHILDVHGLTINDPVSLERELNQIAGVVTVGIFAQRPADLLIIGTPDGVRTL